MLMDRRNFFKVVTGFVVGVFAAFVPKAEGNPQPQWVKDSFRHQYICRPKPEIMMATKMREGWETLGIVERSETYIGKDGKRRYWAWIHPIEMNNEKPLL